MRKIVFAAIILSTVCGCASLNTLYPPSVGISSSILPEYEAYVTNDQSLSQTDKSIRLNNSKMFRKLVEEYGK